MTTRNKEGNLGIVLRAGAVLAIAASLTGCGLFGKKSGDAAAAAPAAPAGARLGAADPADPTPRVEPLHPTANKWYGANGKLFRPITDDREFKERGRASIIASDQEGQPTASGEPYTTRALTAAHSRLPIPSYARVTNVRSGTSTIVRVNDRGAYDRDEAIAISAAAAQKLQLADGDEVQVERITPAEIAAMPAARTPAAAAAPTPAPAAAPPPPVAVAAPQATPPPAETTPLPPPQPVTPAPAVTAAPAPMPVAPAAPAAETPAAPAPAPRTARAPRPIAAAPVAPAAAAVAPAAAAPRAAAASPSGRWSVQVAAFATDSLAESTRARVAQQLASASIDDAPRVERRGNRSYVLLGDFADRDAAEALATRLRTALRRDVVVDRY